MKDDHLIMFLLKNKKKKSVRDVMYLWWLTKNYPSYKDNEGLKDECYNRGYINDVSGYVGGQDENGFAISRHDNMPEIITITKIGERAIYSKELKSEEVEYFFDKTFVRWGLVISGVYGVFSFVENLFSYFKNYFLNG